MLITATDLIKTTLSLYLQNFKLIAKYLGVTLLIWGVLVANSIFGFSLLPKMFGDLPGVITSVSIQIIILGTFFLISLAFSRALQQAIRHEPFQPILKELLAAKKVFWRSFFAQALLGLVATLGTILFIIPGIIFALWYYFSNYAVIFDNQGIIASFKFSKKLTEGRFGAVLWRLVAPTTLYVLFFSVSTWAIITPGQYFLAATGQFSGYWISITLGILFYFLLLPISMITPILLYEHLKMTPNTEQD